MSKGKMIRRCLAYTPRIKQLGYTKLHWVKIHGNVKKDRLTSLCASELIRLHKLGFPFDEDSSAIADVPIIKKAHYWGRYRLACAIATNRIWREKLDQCRINLYRLECAAQDEIDQSRRTWEFMGYPPDSGSGYTQWESFNVKTDAGVQRYINAPWSKHTELYMKELLGAS